MRDLEELLYGAIDMHVHACPDISISHPQKRTNHQVISECQKAGMKGIVLKTHGWPSVGLAHQLNEEINDFTVFPSVSLNKMSGGPHPWTVEMAIAMGARVIWLPTWSALSDRRKGGFGEIAQKYLPRTKTELKESDFYRLIDENGCLLEELKECILLCRDSDIVLCTGHISAEESLAVGRFAREIHYEKLCLTHPVCECSYHTINQLKEFAQMGYYIELCTLNVDPEYGCIKIEGIKRIIDEVGASRCYLSTDHFFDLESSIPEQLIGVLRGLEKEGICYEDLKVMMENPGQILR